MLEIRDVIHKQGPIIFTSKDAYLMQRELSNILHIPCQIEKMVNNQYVEWAKNDKTRGNMPKHGGAP